MPVQWLILPGFLKWVFCKTLPSKRSESLGKACSGIQKQDLQFSPWNDLNLIAEFEKMLNILCLFRGGIEYYINEYVDLRAGISTTEPVSFSGGLSLKFIIFSRLIMQYTNNRGISGITIGFTYKLISGTVQKNSRGTIENAFYNQTGK